MKATLLKNPHEHPLSAQAPVPVPAGEPTEIGAGDALLLPANSLGVGDMQETLRKT
ncbi:hypothetical protein FQZ97_945410 [compost metagenome]